jgi:hypothetical protein
MDSQDYGSPLSNLPPLAWLSGLNLGQSDMSGVSDPSMGGIGATSAPGMEGGLGLDALSELLQSQQGTGEGVNPASLFGSIGGNIGQGTLAQGGPGYSIAGGGLTQPTQQQTGSGYVAGQSQQGGIDPMAIIRQALGLAKRGVGIADALGEESAAPGGASGTGQLGSSSINPAGYSLTGTGAAPEGSPEALAQFFGGEFGSSILNDPTLSNLVTQGLLTGSITPANLSDMSTLGGDRLAGYRLALGEGEIQSDLGNQLLAGSGNQGFSLGGDPTLNMSSPGLPPTDWSGVAQSGIGGGLGLLNLIQGIQGGNVTGGVGGGLQTIGALSSLLRSSPELAQSLGLTSGGLGATGAAAGGLGGLLGLASGAQALSKGDPVGAATGIGGGALGTYGALQALSAAYPSLFGGTALPSLTGAIGSLFGGGGAAGAGAAGAAGAAGGAAGGSGAAGGAGAAGTAGAGAGMGAAAGVGGVLAAAMAPLMIGSMIDEWDPWSEAIKGSMGSYPFFGASLGDTLLQEREGLGALSKLLPSVQSQEQLRQLLDQFKASQETQIGGYGEGSDPFTIPALPGAGGSAHEWGQHADFSRPVSNFNQVIQSLLPHLPATGGGQFVPESWHTALRQQRAGTDARKSGSGYYAPGQHYVRMPDGSFQTMTADQLSAAQAQNAQAQATYQGLYQQFLDRGMTGDAPSTDVLGADPVVSENVLYGDPRYNYAAQGIPGPNWTPGQMSPAWQQLMSQMQPRPPQMAPAPQMATPQMPPQMPQLPQAMAPNAAGLMSQMQFGGQPGMPVPRILEDEIRRMQFAQYGMA